MIMALVNKSIIYIIHKYYQILLKVHNLNTKWFIISIIYLNFIKCKLDFMKLLIKTKTKLKFLKIYKKFIKTEKNEEL